MEKVPAHVQDGASLSAWQSTGEYHAPDHAREGRRGQPLRPTYAEFVSRAGAEVPGYATTTRVNEPGRTLWVKLDLRF